MSNKHKKIAWIFQIIAALILLPVGFLKFTNNPSDIFIFSALEMEPTGRYIIGVLEIISGLFLMTEFLAAMGALLGVGVMCGAIIAHATILGLVINGDNGQHIWLLAMVFISCSTVAYLRRRELPLIGSTL